MRTVICPYCSSNAVLIDSAEVYSGQSFGAIWICRPCKAWVGCHKNSFDHAPLGRLANAELRAAKVAAHAKFDPLWKSGKMHRKEAYNLLAGKLGISVDQCHIGMFDLETCKRVLEVLY